MVQKSADGIDEATTTRLRTDPRERPAFAPGARRVAHEARWTQEAYATMHELLATVPVNWRAPMKTMLFAAMRAADADRDPAQIIRDAFAAYVDRSADASR